MGRARQGAIGALIAVCAWAVGMSGCRLTPEGVLQGPGTPGGAPAAAAPAGPGGAVRLPPGVYLASLVVLDLNSDYGLPVAVAPNAGTFPAGDVRFVVLNKWGGVSPGRHREEVQVIGADGRTVLFRRANEFVAGPEHAFVTTAIPVALQAPAPGWLQVAVALDGAEVARYTFQIEGS